jgi:hypothetical protein
MLISEIRLIVFCSPEVAIVFILTIPGAVNQHRLGHFPGRISPAGFLRQDFLIGFPRPDFFGSISPATFPGKPDFPGKIVYFFLFLQARFLITSPISPDFSG